MGVTVRQKVKGRGQPWWVFIAHNGKRKSIKVGARDAADNLKARIEEKLKAGELRIADEKTVPTFGEYARKWLDGHVETSLKFTTQKSYDYIMRIHLGGLMDRPLDQITRPELRDLIYEKLKSGLAPKTVVNIKAVISSLLNHAFEDGLIHGEPGCPVGKIYQEERPESRH